MTMIKFKNYKDNSEKTLKRRWQLFLLSLHDFEGASLTLSSRIVISRSADELLSAGAQSREARQQFIQLQPLSAMLCQLLSDLLHLCSHRRGLPQTLHRPLQSLQERVHLIMKLEAERSRRHSYDGDRGAWVMKIQSLSNW